MKSIRKVVFTTSQNQAGVNSRFLKNLELFIKEQGVDKVYIFATRGRNRFDDKAYLDKEGRVVNSYGPSKKILKLVQDGISGAEVEIIYETYKNGVSINSNLIYFHSKMVPQNVDPFRGLVPKLPRDKSIIVNATKIRFEVIGTDNIKSSRTITSTGAITYPRYNLNFQTGVKAVEMHTFGFTYVELFKGDKFMIHPIIASTKGSFTYDTKKYKNGVVSRNKTKVLVLGDIHRAVMDKKAILETRQQIKNLKPKFVVIHDLHDGSSINHHVAKSFIHNISRSSKRRDSLEVELKGDMAFLKRLAVDFPKQTFLIVESNHDEFIKKYIDTKQFLEDPKNILFISKMLHNVINNPKHIPILQIAMEYLNGGRIAKNIKFLKQDDHFRIGGKLVSMHGHKGLSGSRGTPSQYERHNLKAITGHTHSPKIYSNGAVVGHLTDLEKQDYARGGISNWLLCNISVDELNKIKLHILRNNFK